MTCAGIHCAGCGAGVSIPPIGLAATLGLAWVAEHLIEVALVSAACGILSVAAVVALMRWTARREAAFAAALAARRERPTLTATATPQATAPTVQVVEHHHYVHAIPAPDPASAIVRAAITGTPGDAITARTGNENGR